MLFPSVESSGQMIGVVELLEVADETSKERPEECRNAANVAKTGIEGIYRVRNLLLVSRLRKVDNEAWGDRVGRDKLLKLLFKLSCVNRRLVWSEEEVIAQIKPLESPKLNLGLHYAKIEAIRIILYASHLLEIAFWDLIV